MQDTAVASTDRSDDALVTAVRDHLRLQMMAIGHTAPGGVAHVSDHALLAHVGRPSLYNQGTAIDLEQPDLGIAEVERFFGTLPHTLWLDEDAIGDDTDALLRARGYVPLPPQHGMAHTGPAPADDLDVPVRLLTRTSEAAACAEIVASGFAAGPDDQQLLEDLARAILRHARPWDHGALYGASHGDRLVSVAALLCTHAAAGIVALATTPGERHQHRAAALVGRMLRDATAHGYEVAVTIATPESRPVLEPLGFRPVTCFHVYRRGHA